MGNWEQGKIYLEMALKEKFKSMYNNIKPYFAVIVVMLFSLNLFYMISIENRLKGIDFQVKENKRELSNLEYELLRDKSSKKIKGNQDGILGEILSELEELEQKVDGVKSEVRYLPISNNSKTVHFFTETGLTFSIKLFTVNSLLDALRFNKSSEYLLMFSFIILIMSSLFGQFFFGVFFVKSQC